jgi:hypothetical protein
MEAGVRVDIKFINQFARSQRLEDVSNILGFTNEVGMLSQLKPDVIDYYDADEALKLIANIRSVPESIISPDEEVEAIRAEKQQLQQGGEALEAATKLADISSKS